MAVLTINPSLDGYVGRDGNGLGTGTNWSTDYVNWNGESGGGGVVNSSSTTAYAASGRYNSSGEFTLFRHFILFDTSGLTSGATISSAVLRLYAVSKIDDDDDANSYLNVFSSNPASNSALAVADTDQVGSTKFSSDVDITGVTTSAYLEFTLNASGLSAISKTGITKLSLREGHDVANDAPTAGVDRTNRVIFSSVDSASNKPELVITYTLPAKTIEHCADGDTVALWHMNGAVNSTEKKNDESANGLDLTEVNTPTAATGFDGTVNGAYHITAANNESLDATNYNITSSFTIEAWLNPTSFTNIARILSNGNSDAESYFMEVNASGFLGIGYSGQAVQLDTTTALSTGSWQYVAVIHNDVSDIDSLYVNGTLVKSFTGKTGNPSAGGAGSIISIGMHPSTGGNYNQYDGDIDEVVLSTRAKSAEEIAKYYSGTVSAKFYPTTDGRLRQYEQNSWANTIGAATASALVQTGADGYIEADNYSGSTFECDRYVATFDASSMPNVVTIAVGTMGITAVATTGTDANWVVNVYNSNHADTITTADYNDVGSTAWSDTTIALASFTAGVKTWAFNATGIAGISKTGLTKLCLRESYHDVGGSATGLAANPGAYFNFYMVAQTGTTNDPYLWIEYVDTSDILITLATSINLSSSKISGGAKLLRAYVATVVLSATGIATRFLQILLNVAIALTGKLYSRQIATLKMFQINLYSYKLRNEMIILSSTFSLSSATINILGKVVQLIASIALSGVYAYLQNVNRIKAKILDFIESKKPKFFK